MKKPPSQAPQPPKGGVNPQPPVRGLLEIERPCQGSGVSLGVSSINLKPEHLKIIKEILFKFIPNTEVWAFGSRVKFTNAEFADLDLVIVDENKQSLSTMAKLEEAFEQSDLPFEVDILDYCSIAEHLKKEINKKYMKLIDPKSVKEGYKDTPLGLIPKDWEIVSSGEICELTAGGTPSTSIFEYWGGSIRWMNSGEINKKRVDEVEGRITEEGLKNSSTKILPIHCVLIALAGQGKTRGTVAINEVELCTNQSIAAFIPKEKVLYEYLFFNLDNRYDELRSLSAGDGGRGGLNLSILRVVQISLPPLEEQKKIAEILSTWDQGIDKLKLLIENKKYLKKGLMQKLLTGRVRVKPPNPLKGELLGLTPPRVFDCADKKLYEKLKLKAQDMRHNRTKAEAILWENLKDNSLGVKFRRQHIINRYIVDFYCVENSLIIELDGEIHEEQKEEDQQRQEFLESLDCHVIRFKNEEVFENLELVLSKIKNKLFEKPSNFSKEQQQTTTNSPFRGLGGFPEDWQIVRLGDVCQKVLGGGTPSTTCEDYWNGSIPWVTSADIVDLRTIEPRKFITEEAIQKSATNLVPKGSIVVATRVGLGKVGINLFDLCTSQDCQSLILDNRKSITEYILYKVYLQAQEFTKQSRGSTIQGITKSQLVEIQIPLPSLEEQKKIAEILSTQDKEINDLEKKLELFKQQKKGLMQILLTGRVRV